MCVHYATCESVDHTDDHCPDRHARKSSFAKYLESVTKTLSIKELQNIQKSQIHVEMTVIRYLLIV